MRRALPMLVLVVACTTGNGVSAPTGTPPTTSGTTTTTAPPPMCVEGARPFVATGNAGTLPRGESDAERLERVRWWVTDACTRIEIAFATAVGAPAVDPPGIAAAFLRDVGILRVTLGSDVVGSTVAEHALDGALAERVFVVTGLDGTVFLDVHLGAPAFARVETITAPGRVVVELRPGGPEYGTTPLVADGIVVVDRPREAAPYPFSVSGYVRPGTGSVTGTLEVGGETIEVRGPHGDTRSTWGSFVLLVPDGPSGDAVLTVDDIAVLELVTG